MWIWLLSYKLKNGNFYFFSFELHFVFLKIKTNTFLIYSNNKNYSVFSIYFTCLNFRSFLCFQFLVKYFFKKIIIKKKTFVKFRLLFIHSLLNFINTFIVFLLIILIAIIVFFLLYFCITFILSEATLDILTIFLCLFDIWRIKAFFFFVYCY